MTDATKTGTDCFVIGIDNSECSLRALEFVQVRAELLNARVVVVYVIEWSPYSFNTPEENEQRHKRREQEISTASDNVLAPAMARIEAAGISAEGIVRHGNVADVLDAMSREFNATQIVVGRVGESGLKSLIFGSVTSKLVQISTVPVTVVP